MEAKKKAKKKILIVPALVMALSMAVPAPLMAEDTVPLTAEDTVPVEVTAPVAPLSITNGVVTELIDNGTRKAIRIQSEDAGEIDFVITDDAVYLDETGIIAAEDFKAGDKITAYYVKPEAMIMIYPPQFQFSVVLVKESESGLPSVQIGLYEDDLLNSKTLASTGGLVLHMTEETPIVDTQNEPYTESLAGKVLAVYYQIQTSSIPAQTTPERIVVLDINKAHMLADMPDTPAIPGIETDPVPVPEEPNEPAPALTTATVPAMRFEIDGAVVEAPAAFMNDEGVVMLPIRALAEKLGYTVHWDGAYAEVRLGNAISFRIGQDAYLIGRMTPITLGTTPVIQNDLTYVPIDFFEKVLRIDVRVSAGKFEFFNETDAPTPRAGVAENIAVTLNDPQPFEGCPDVLNVSYVNNSDIWVYYGEPFSIEKLEDGVWQNVPMSEGYAFNLPLYALPPDSSQEKGLYLQGFKENITTGTYRAVCEIDDDDTLENRTTYTVYCEFTIV